MKVKIVERVKLMNFWPFRCFLPIGTILLLKNTFKNMVSNANCSLKLQNVMTFAKSYDEKTIFFKKITYC